ncbi:hypothetical protein RRG08_055258 [Elysia crispata]|uniref:Uncharacterized protein n=1 Tax=Elysia crispata TaxID=231223 RepID=A0AAE1CMD1_9GAST|nr:hypothetical protein RRG08_055258 [Elysia crispata]
MKLYLAVLCLVSLVVVSATPTQRSFYKEFATFIDKGEAASSNANGGGAAADEDDNNEDDDHDDRDDDDDDDDDNDDDDEEEEDDEAMASYFKERIHTQFL